MPVIRRYSTIVRSPRVRQLEGMFDIPPAERTEVTWSVDLPLAERKWNVGLIHGPSGSGKSTVARELFGSALIDEFPWPDGASIVDGFPESLGIHDITGLLSSVGFSSPPAWLRPFAVLSTGEKFRVTLARALAEAAVPGRENRLVVMDEFTSVVDRTVAQIGSAALARAVRARQQQFVAVSCHSDIIEWLQPDWIYEPATGEFHWRSLRRRPAIAVVIRRAAREWWSVFRPHHYLSADLADNALCFVAFIHQWPAAFCAAVVMPGRVTCWREHRLVCLPDFQGVGLGNALSEFVAGVLSSPGRPYRSISGHPALIRHRERSRHWRVTRRAADISFRKVRHLSHGKMLEKPASGRATASFLFTGPTWPGVGQRLGLEPKRPAPFKKMRPCR